jgi:hypothetical protein
MLTWVLDFHVHARFLCPLALKTRPLLGLIAPTVIFRVLNYIECHAGLLVIGT